MLCVVLSALSDDADSYLATPVCAVVFVVDYKKEMIILLLLLHLFAVLINLLNCVGGFVVHEKGEFTICRNLNHRSFHLKKRKIRKTFRN